MHYIFVYPIYRFLATLIQVPMFKPYLAILVLRTINPIIESVLLQLCL